MPINIPTRTDTNTSLYISNLSDTTGKTYRELKSLWDKFNNEVQYDVMYNPTKYMNFSKLDLYSEVGKRLEEYLNNPTGVAEEEVQEQETEQIEQNFGNEIENNLETQSEEVPMEEPIPEGEPTTPEVTLEDETTGDIVEADEVNQTPSEDELDAIFTEFGI